VRRSTSSSGWATRRTPTSRSRRPPRSRHSCSSSSATVDVVEWLGNETYAYIPFEAPPEVEAQLLQLERDLDGESLHTQLVVSLDGASRIKEGEEAEIWVDGSKIHLFDPGTGENLTVDRENAGRLLEQPVAEEA
jgi:multiple sugar transport system ATP-binding protein